MLNVEISLFSVLRDIIEKERKEYRKELHETNKREVSNRESKKQNQMLVHLVEVIDCMQTLGWKPKDQTEEEDTNTEKDDDINIEEDEEQDELRKGEGEGGGEAYLEHFFAVFTRESLTNFEREVE